MIAKDLSEQKALHTNRKAIQLINFTVNLEQQATMCFVIEEAKVTVLDFSQGTIKLFYFYFLL